MSILCNFVMANGDQFALLVTQQQYVIWTRAILRSYLVCANVGLACGICMQMIRRVATNVRTRFTGRYMWIAEEYLVAPLPENILQAKTADLPSSPGDCSVGRNLIGHFLLLCCCLDANIKLLYNNHSEVCLREPLPSFMCS